MNTTVLIPWDGKNEAWLNDCLLSFPSGTPFVVAKNDGKHEMAHALNASLADIHTEYTFVCGADDLAEPGMLEALEAGIGSADGAYPLVELFGDREWTFHPPIWSPHLLQYRNICGVFLVRTRVLREVGGWRDAVIEDWELVNRIAKAGYRFERVLGATYRYRQHDTSLTQRIENVARKERFTTAEQMKEILGDKLERYPLEAVFYGQASMAQNYVRGCVPAEHLPGVCTDLLWKHNLDCDVAVWLYPAKGSLEQAYGDASSEIRIVDVDDNYASPRLVRELERAGRKELADMWSREQSDHIEFVRRADAVFCATPKLAEVYADLNPNVHVLRNGILEADWRRVRVPGEDGKVRIGWAAGRQHEPDAEIIEPALRSIKKKYGDKVDVRIIGLDPKWDFEYTALPFTPTLAAYRDAISEFDISLAPLKRNEMNESKSDLKWLEASMAGAAFVCTDYEPYALVEDGVTGLKCESRADWFDAIDSLVVDEARRTEMSEQARIRVLEQRGSEIVSDRYRDALARVRESVGVAA